jgi:hypothetical protein
MPTETAPPPEVTREALERRVYNGDLGIVRRVDAEEGKLVVAFDGRGEVAGQRLGREWTMTDSVAIDFGTTRTKLACFAGDRPELMRFEGDRPSRRRCSTCGVAAPVSCGASTPRPCSTWTLPP